MDPHVLKVNKKAMKVLKKLQTFDKIGKIYIPKQIRDKFPDCQFYIEIVDGKIVLDPVKIEYVDEDDGRVENER
jgi:hypothetical protein